jgi:hypothetical protein
MFIYEIRFLTIRKVSILGNFSNWEKFIFKESFIKENGTSLHMLSYAIIESFRK